MKKVFWGAIVLLFLFSGMAFAETANEAFEKGKEAFLNGDYITAAKCFRKAAEQGNAYAQYNLGVMYYEGKGVPQDYVQSYIWLSIAAANLSGDLREQILNIRDIVAKGLSPKQLEEAQKIASEWKPKRGTP